MVVAFFYRTTAPVIAANEQARLMKVLSELMPEADEYRTSVKEGKEIHLGLKDGEVIAAVVPGEAQGYAAEPVKILALVSPDGKVQEVVVARHRETPGIGNKIEARVFLAQFRGVFGIKGQDLEDVLVAGVDAISGATISSLAVAKGVARAVHLFTTP